MVGRAGRLKDREESGGVSETPRAGLLVGVKPARATGGDETLMLAWAGAVEAWPNAHLTGNATCDIASENGLWRWRGATIAGGL